MTADFEIERFEYTKEQAQTVYDYLDSNENDLVKVFDCVWHDTLFTNAQRRSAPMLLSFIDRIRALKSPHVCGRDFERVWNCEMVHAKDEIHDSSK